MLKFGTVLCLLVTSALVTANAQAATKKAYKTTSSTTTRVSGVQKSEIAETEYGTSGSALNGRLIVEPSFGFAFINPSDLNGLIRDNNDQLQKQGVKSFSASEFGSTVAYGGVVSYRVMPALGLGLGFHRMSATNEGSAKVGDKNLNGTYSIGANLLTAESRITVLSSADRKIEGLFSPFIGVGFYNANEAFSGSAMANGSNEVGSSATGVVAGTSAGVRFWALQNLALGMNVGYRYAKSGVLKIDSQKNTDQAVGSQVESNGKKIQLDTSSIQLNAQLSWAI